VRARRRPVQGRPERADLAPETIPNDVRGRPMPFCNAFSYRVEP